MVKLIIGVRGAGKTKQLIELVNACANQSKGTVVCIEKGRKLNFDITYKARLIDSAEYYINDAQALYGLIAGIAASDHDITDIFVDSLLKICGEDMASLETFLPEVATLSEKYHFNCIMTLSADPATLPKYIRQYS